MTSTALTSCFLRLIVPSAGHRHTIIPSAAPPSSFYFSSLPPPPPPPPLRLRLRRRSYCCVAYSAAGGSIYTTWLHSEDDGYGGWSVQKPQISPQTKRDYLKIILAGFGTSVLLLVVALMHWSHSRKGFKFQLTAQSAPLHAFRELLLSSEYTKFLVRDSPQTTEKDQLPELKLDNGTDKLGDASKSKEDAISAMHEKKPVFRSVASDSRQQEAVHLLKKLKIIDDDVNGDELCTRREFARWLVKANTILERSPRCRIVPSMSIVSSTSEAFDDVIVSDPDFWCIQALAEAGIVHSRLSADSTSLTNDDSPHNHEIYDFLPESYASRFDLVKWRILLEYPFHSILGNKMSRINVGLMDLDTVDLDALPQLVVDLMAGEKSIVRRAFGNTRRLEPHKPATKAQAAVVLSSGRMAEAIQLELARIEAENQTQLAEMEDIRFELLNRGDIQKFWEDRLRKERVLAMKVEKDLHAAFVDLETEKMNYDEFLAKCMKERAALDCQHQLLRNLKKEIDEMSDRLASERISFSAERQGLEKMTTALHEKQDAISEKKAVLEAEREALHILRSWVEEEALRTQARIKILEGALQRWNWSEEHDNHQASPTENSNDSMQSQGDER